MDLDRRRIGAALAAGAAGLAGGCTVGNLNLLNRLTPGDGGSRKLAEAQPFGPDPRQRLDVYGPADRAGQAPVVVFFYGGNWSSGDRRDYGFVGHALASRGFVTVVPDYRLVPAVRFPGFVEDGAAAVKWAVQTIARHGGDPRRIGLSGHSAGAYISAMVALDRRWLNAAGVDPASVRCLANLAGPYDFFPFDVEASKAAFGAYPNPAATQPINFARADAPPAFLAYGTEDRTVMPRNSIRLAEALKAKGAEAELKPYPGLDHADLVVALSKPFRGKAPVLSDLTAFLHRRLA